MHHKKCSLWYTQSTISGCTKTEHFSPNRYIALSLIIYLIFHKTLAPSSQILVYFYLKAMPENSSQRSIIKGCTEGAQKKSRLEPEICFIENKNLHDYHRSISLLCYMFYFTMAGYLKLNGFFCACCYFCITCCSARRLTTIDVKGLLYLMSFLFFASIKYLCVKIIYVV